MSRAHRWPFVLAGVIVAALAVLAKMQIDRIAQLSQNREQRERAELESAARRFGGEIDFSVMRIGGLFELHDSNARELAERYERWRTTAADPRILGAIYVVQPGEVFRFDPEQGVLRPSQLPAELAAIVTNDIVPRFVPEIPALIFPIREHPREMLLLQIDTAYLARGVMPRLARELFGAEYDVVVARGEEPLFRSNPQWLGADADVVAPLFSMRERRPEREERPPMPPPPPLWRILVRHHGLSLGEVIAAARRREIAITSLILVLLGAVAITLAVAARRAERLRRQQLEFVAGITHELNTPLAALGAAGQNLVDGVAGDTARYGEAIVKETRRLIDLVDQILQFGGMQTRAARSDATSLPRAAIDDALAQCRWMAAERGVSVECDAKEDLPAVRGDAASVTRAVQNLVANAIRHGGEGKWVGVRAGRDDGFVDITVEDRGPGIAAADLPHLFEPFYRGRNAQTRGSGIGLAIVDRIARAHGGRVSVAKHRERGAAFTLRLPVAETPP
jgi:signal transduction histidine kinase